MNLKNKIITVTAFAIAMGFLEGAVVVYLREILYPDGFRFPLVPVPVNLAATELLREVATLAMLVTLGILAGRRFSTGFAWFIYGFAVWDIFYYIFLKLVLGWPESLMTWDVLFLIPTTWTGPVLAPIVVSLTMIFFALVILIHAGKGIPSRINGLEWGGFVLGSLLLIVGFIYDYAQHMLVNLSLGELFDMNNPEVMEVATRYIPYRFRWLIFTGGELIILAHIGLYWRRVGKFQKSA